MISYLRMAKLKHLCLVTPAADVWWGDARIPSLVCLFYWTDTVIVAYSFISYQKSFVKPVFSLSLSMLSILIIAFTSSILDFDSNNKGSK
ncbi:hypothetical protein G9A89_023679 [Geosiphon pyriformis]|nr:hypothetical protein G9A89_023679 [Geosiphon pyriformis]